MIKVLTNIILILVVLLSQFYNSLVVVGYEINYDYYAEELCENTDKPELHCDGKCFFAKQLALDEDRQGDTEPPTLLPSPRLFPTTAIIDLPTPEFSEISKNQITWQQRMPKYFLGSEIDHPPRS